MQIFLSHKVSKFPASWNLLMSFCLQSFFAVFWFILIGTGRSTYFTNYWSYIFDFNESWVRSWQNKSINRQCPPTNWETVPGKWYVTVIWMPIHLSYYIMVLNRKICFPYTNVSEYSDNFLFFPRHFFSTFWLKNTSTFKLFIFTSFLISSTHMFSPVLFIKFHSNQNLLTFKMKKKKVYSEKGTTDGGIK